nr:hypothetical protein [Marinobacter sp. X15-166B]
MKLGKKKKQNDAPQQAESKTPALKQLTGVALLQSLVVVMAGAVAAALMLVIVVQPATETQAQQQIHQAAAQSRFRVEQQLTLLEDLLAGVAAQPAVVDGLQDPALRKELESGLTDLLPGMRQVALVPYGEVPRTADNAAGLGFASLELLRRAETGHQVHADAFPRDGQWFVQLAAPVRHPATEALVGSMLWVLDGNLLMRLLTHEDAGAARLALVQTVAGNANTLASFGTGGGAPVVLELSTPNWALHYAPSPTTTPALNTVWMIALIVGSSLLAAVLVWVLSAGAQKALRREASALTQWAHKAFSGERATLPQLHWGLMASLGEVLQRLAQVADKRAERVMAAPLGAAASAAARGPGSLEEPMFQESDLLGIDMLDGDDDVLGLDDEPSPGELTAAAAPDAPATPAPVVAEVAADIFRAYDIRGIVDETLTTETVELIGRAVGSEALARGLDTLCVGWDGRHSSPQLAAALSRGVDGHRLPCHQGGRGAHAGIVFFHPPSRHRFRRDGDRQPQPGQL